MNNISVLNDVIAVNLLFSVWTGRKTLKDGDLRIDGKMPPKEVITLGSKHTTDPKALTIFNTLKRRAERLLKSVGIPFMGGYAIPSGKADFVAKELHSILNQFDKEKSAYLLKHSDIQQEWIAKYPDWEQALKQALTAVEDVEKRIHATFSMFKIQSVENEMQHDSGISKQVTALSGTLDKDVLKESSVLLESLSGAIRPCQTNVRGVAKLREKIEGLAFLNGRFNLLVNEIKKVEKELPVVGNLTVDEKNKLSGLLFRMSSETRLAELMNQISTTEKTNEATQADSVTNENSMLFENDVSFDFDADAISVAPQKVIEDKKVVNSFF